MVQLNEFERFCADRMAKVEPGSVIQIPSLPEGIKFDTGKLPWSLLPLDSIQEVVKVLQFGAQKYEPRNWEKGMMYSRLFDASLRHLSAWWQGKSLDDDSKLSHLAHAACDILFLLAYELRDMGPFDDRP